jgi:TonB family protein
MNRFHAVLSVALLLLSSAAVQAAAASNTLESLRLVDSSLPPYPADMMALGIREGDVRVAISVDTEGRVEDALPIAYTRPEFARPTASAIRRWRFEPARYRGQPIAAATEVAVHFAVEGTVVVSMTPIESISRQMSMMFADNNDAYRPRLLHELDRIPTPLSAPSPAFPREVHGPSSVTVSFYIDENGAVRLPSVDSTEDPLLAAVAIDALRNWKFEPPTRHGRPVLVHASQEFKFVPGAKS